MLKLVKNKISKKIVALVLLILTIFSVTQPIFAASGTGSWVGGQFDSGMKTTDYRNSDLGILIRRLYNTKTQEWKTVFCAQHRVDFVTGSAYNGRYYTPTNDNIKQACKVAYLGWYKDYPDYIVNGGILSEDMKWVKQQYVFTQQMIWEVLGQTNSTFLDPTVQSDYVSFKTDINNKINTMQTRPSFNNTTITLEAGETKTITDTNGVLSQYKSIDKTVDGIRFVHNKGENTMNITVSIDCELEQYRVSDATMKSWGLIKEGTEDKDTTVYFEFEDDVQDQLYSLNYNDPVTMNISLKIDLTGSLELSKLNENGDLVDGAVFNITGPNGYNQNVTVTSGKITIDKLKKGVYTIKEVSAPYNYLLDTNSYNVEIKVNQKATQAIVNVEPTGTFTLIKKNSSKTANLKGAEYRIWNDNYDQTFKTNDEGKIEVSGLKLGKYSYKETKAPEGYLIDEKTYSFEIKYKDQNTAVIYESAERTDDEPTGEISLIKTDGETGNQNRVDNTSHHGDAQIKGAVYTLYAKTDIYNKAKTIKYFDKDDSIATYTFNEYGVASIKIINNDTTAQISIEGNTLKGLPLGSFYAKETTVPKGYMKDENVYDYTLSFKDNKTKVVKEVGTVVNTVEKAPFEVIKISTNNNTTAETVENAEFTAILSKYVKFYGGFDEARKHLSEFAQDEYSIFRTGADGHGVSSLLAYGDYTVNETYTPSPEIETVEEFYVSIDKNSRTPIKELVENDLPFEAYIKLEKKDAKTGKYVTYSNATFSLFKLNEETSTWEKVQCKVGKDYYDSWTTDENGIARTEEKLPSGIFKVEEIRIPEGFIEFDGELRFEVNNKNKTLNYDKDLDAWITVTVENEQPTGTLKLKKLVNLRQNVDKTLIKDIDYTQIAFELVAAKDIIDYADGSIIYEKGKVIDNYNLNADGTLTVENVPMGEYYIKEISTIKGAVLNNTKYPVVFNIADTKTKEYEVNLNIENETTLIEISKQDIVGTEELKGAKLTVTDEDGNIIDQWISTDKPHTIEGLEVGKDFTLKEELAPEGYVKASEVKFRVESTGEVQKVKMIDKIVEMSKVDIAGEEIEGAEIVVIDENGNIVDKWISTKESHKIKSLEEGKTYTLKESYAVDGYVVATDITFTVDTNKETQHLEMIDKVVEVVKTDFVTGEEVEGAKLQVVDEEGNIIDEWISSKEAHKVKGLKEGKTYQLLEKTCPYGYEIAESIEFTVSKDKETQKIEMKDMPILQSVKLIKKDSKNEEIIKDKFVFGIFEDEGCTKLIEEVESDKKQGIVLFENLRYGVFFIKELSAPKGYMLSDQVIKVEINDKGVFIDGEKVEGEDSVYTFEFYNTPIDTPKTGDNSNMIGLIALLVMSALTITGIGVHEYRKRKDNK